MTRQIFLLLINLIYSQMTTSSIQISPNQKQDFISKRSNKKCCAPTCTQHRRTSFDGHPSALTSGEWLIEMEMHLILQSCLDEHCSSQNELRLNQKKEDASAIVRDLNFAVPTFLQQLLSQSEREKRNNERGGHLNPFIQKIKQQFSLSRKGIGKLFSSAKNVILVYCSIP